MVDNTHYMKKLALVLALVAGIVMFPATAFAEEQVCTQAYGGGVVCGASTVHEPVDTAFGDINPIILGSAFILASGAVLLVSRKINSRLSSQA